MTGISTSQQFAILRTNRGMELETFSNQKGLAEQAIRNAQWEIGHDKTPQWLRDLADALEREANS